MAEPSVTYVYYFCDESSYVNDTYMAVAGLAVPDFEVPKMTADLRALKQAKGGPSEVKWSTVKSRRDSIHHAFVDYFADAVAAKRIHFHIRFAPFNEYDHNASGQKKRVDTTSKMHFQLLLHRAVRFYGKYYRLRTGQTMAIAPLLWPTNWTASKAGGCTTTRRRQVASKASRPAILAKRFFFSFLMFP